MSDNLLSLKNVSKEYSGNRVLKDINIDLKKGQIHEMCIRDRPWTGRVWR